MAHPTVYALLGYQEVTESTGKVGMSTKKFTALPQPPKQN